MTHIVVFSPKEVEQIFAEAVQNDDDLFGHVVHTDKLKFSIGRSDKWPEVTVTHSDEDE